MNIFTIWSGHFKIKVAAATVCEDMFITGRCYYSTDSSFTWHFLLCFVRPNTWEQVKKKPDSFLNDGNETVLLKITTQEVSGRSKVYLYGLFFISTGFTLETTAAESRSTKDWKKPYRSSEWSPPRGADLRGQTEPEVSDAELKLEGFIQCLWCVSDQHVCWVWNKCRWCPGTKRKETLVCKCEAVCLHVCSSGGRGRSCVGVGGGM